VVGQMTHQRHQRVWNPINSLPQHSDSAHLLVGQLSNGINNQNIHREAKYGIG
jgi:hypothetical protein